jgi:hypothetical protein
MRTLNFLVTFTFADAGRLAPEEIEKRLKSAIGNARDEGDITPNDDDHAMLVDHKVESLPRKPGAAF